MSASAMKTPLLFGANISTIEIKGPIDMFKSRYKYLIRVNQDGQQILEGESGSTVREAGEFRIKWDINKDLLFALSSTTKLSIRSKGRLLEHDIGEFEGNVVDFVDNDSYFELVTKGKSTSVKLRVTITKLDAKTHTADYVKEVMTKVDGELATMVTLNLPDPDNGGVKFVMGQILRFTKSIMDKVAEAHPFLKVAWSAFAFVYEAVEKTTREDKAVRDLAKSLREMLGVANARPELLVIKDTTNVIAEMSILALRIAQVIHEYSSTGVVGRALRLSIPGSSLHSRIQQYQADHRELMEQFRTRLGISSDVQLETLIELTSSIPKVVEDSKITGGIESQTSVRLFRPIATTRFIGRQKEIGLLKAHFEIRDTTGARRRNTSGARRSFLISGMGGIGKTQLCLQFVEDAMDNSTFSRVFYIDAATEESIASSFKGIFHNTSGLKSSGLSESPDSVLAWISRLEEDWLIVYDNAEDSVANYLPRGRRGNILMTSRNPGLARETGGAHIALNKMSEEDALALFKSSGCHQFLSPEDEQMGRKIVSSLSFIPLAVDLAGAYTASSTGFCDLHEYLQWLSVKRTEVFHPFEIANKTPYNNTIYGAWELSMKGLEDMAASSHARQEAAESALAILQIFSWFHHSNIDESIFKRAAVAYHTASAHENDFFHPPMLSSLSLKILQRDGTKNDWNNGYFRKGIQMLLSASLIKKSMMSERVVYSVHPLIHEWVQNKHISQNQTLAQDAHIIMLSSISFDDVLYQQTITPLLPHIKAYQQYTLDQILINQEYNDYIFGRLQFFYRNTSLFREEENVLVIIIEHQKQALGENMNTLDSMGVLASCLKNQGKLAEAEEMYCKVIALQTKIMGDDHPSTLASRHNLGSLYADKGQWEEAKAIFLPVLEALTRVFSEENTQTLYSMHGLAHCLQNQGKLAEEEEMYSKVIALETKILGDDHPLTLASRHNLASLYATKGQWEEAKAILLLVVEARIRVFGEENMDTLSSMHGLAHCLQNQGKLAEAEEMYSKVVALQTKILGDDHPLTLTSRHNLASLYADKGQWEEAKAIFLPVLEALTRVFGEENTQTPYSMHGLAHCLQNQGKLAEAEEMYSKVIALETKILGDDHPLTLTSRNNLGSLYADKGQWEEAKAIFLPVLEALTRVFGEENTQTLYSMHGLAHCLQNQGKLAEAEEMYSKVIALKTKILGDDHPLTLTSRHNLGTLYADKGQWEEAKAILLLVVEARIRVFGEENMDTLSSMHELAGCLQTPGKLAEAEEMYSKVIALETKILGDDHPSTLTSRHNLGSLYAEQGQWEKAEVILIPVLQARRSTEDEFTM
ncbi:hypothetical protein D9613_012146 [Agrocybe pediades]|uniref:NB-ARC domain-containing protein n=1 Tax=Agrocybe pediades TaxID=84607 RepID=A0A8H4R3Z1_9AGAR|nr:hypothetical protein D9613_012146 [Agrocybe pediades]